MTDAEFESTVLMAPQNCSATGASRAKDQFPKADYVLPEKMDP